MLRRTIALCILLVTLHHYYQPVDAIIERRSVLTRNKKMAPSQSTRNDSTVLRELKETIRKQNKEIDVLKLQLKTSAPASGTAAAHGHGGDVDEEIVAHYKDEPFWYLSYKRVGWLGVFLGSLSLTAVIMNTFEHTLEKHIELAYFVPLLAGHGGNTGGQTVGTVLSALSAGTIKPSDAPQIIMKEAMSGVLSGLILGVFVAPISYKVLGISYHVALVLFLTMPLVATIAAALGSMIPFTCVFLRLDPSVIAAPAMTSIVDVAGLMSYFMIANYVFKMVGLEL